MELKNRENTIKTDRLMNKNVKIILCVSAAVVALVILFNLLPNSIRTTATICAGFGVVAGAIAGWKVKTWYDQMKE